MDYEDLEAEVDDHENRLTTVEETVALLPDPNDPNARINQLDFPLDTQTIDLIMEQLQLRTGQAVLVGGTITISGNSYVTLGSIIIISRLIAGGTLGHLSVANIVVGGFDINSTSGSETSIVNYLIV